MEKIKVCHVITLLELGGAQQNTLFTVQNLDRNRFDVSLVCGRGGILDAEAEKISALKRFFVPNLVRPIHPLKDFLCLWDLVSIFKREKPQIVHTHSSKAGILGRIAARLAGVPVIVHSIHGFGFNPYQKFFVRRLFIVLEKWTAAFSRTLIAVAQENIREGLALGIGRKEQYVLIRSGVDIEKIKTAAAASDPSRLKAEFGIPAAARVVLTIGPFKLQKDPLAFVRLAQKVARDCPDARFLMSGDGELRPQIEALIRSSGLEKNIRLLGWRRDIPALLAMCDVFVLTSLWEGLPRAGVEALILGKPTVAFAVDGIREIVRDGENGHLLPPGRLDAMAEKLSGLLKDERLLRAQSARAAQTIDGSFDIRHMVRQQEALYAELAPR